ncbi:MAG: 1-hydroxy-2-methyl-2-(E)-butenyl 4-diphosphate synthase [Chloroflexi bacterium]|nr:1-hydroxy-2-methyl-2-(E)-butenyl 4-diphosphate synthase [Chloroflexota bacterium]
MSSTVIDQAASRPTPAYVANPYRPRRRRTREVMVGNVGVGGDNPVRVQSMTTTRTQDVEATTAQAVSLVEVGCEIVRITAPTVSDARAIGEVRARLRAMGITVPLVADIHFSPAAASAATEYVDKVRVNPGNFADSRKFATREYTDAEYAQELERVAAKFIPVVLACKERGVAMRIGTNHGSLSDRVMNRFGDSPEGMVESALEFVRICEGLAYYDIILSMKASNPKVMIAAYRLLVARMSAEGMAYPLHLGVTEAGNGDDARIKSATGIGSLLLDGLGDTIRVSLAEDPEAEIPVAQQIVALCSLPFSSADDAPLTDGPNLSYDPFHYERRHSRPVQLGAVQLGAGATIAVAGQVPAREPIVLPVNGNRGLKAYRPDLLVWDLAGPADLARLGELAWKGEGTAPRPLVARSADLNLLEQALPHVEAVRLVLDGSQPEPVVLKLAHASATRQVALWLEADLCGEEPEDRVRTLVSLARASELAGQTNILASLHSPDAASAVRGTRLLAAQLAAVGVHCPLVLLAPVGEAPMLSGAAALGSLLCDGIGDAAQAASVPLAFDLLQGAGARLTRTDYVACPSCGRTLFDLQSTTERIKAGTSHLKGVKLAIMGCVVNGPGEMADADFGYMGGSPGRVNLYVGKECVERNVPEAEADQRLIALIRAHGRWIEPDSDHE